MLPSRLLEIRQTAQLFGSSNGWTGTSGKLSTMIMELIAEIEATQQSLARGAPTHQEPIDVRDPKAQLNSLPNG